MMREQIRAGTKTPSRSRRKRNSYKQRTRKQSSELFLALLREHRVMSSKQVAEAMDRGGTSVSRFASELVERGLVRKERRGREVYFVFTGPGGAGVDSTTKKINQTSFRRPG